MANNEDLDNNNNNEEWSTIDVSASGNSANNGIEFEIEQEAEKKETAKPVEKKEAANNERPVKELSRENQSDSEDKSRQVSKSSEEDVAKNQEPVPEELQGITTKGAEKRIRQLIKQRKEREEENNNLRKELEELKNSLKEREVQLSTSVKSSLESNESQISSRLERAKLLYRQAAEQGDPDKMLEAQEEISKAYAESSRLEQQRAAWEEYNARLEQQNVRAAELAKQQKQQEAQYDPKAVQWASKNNWFGQDQLMTAAALSIDAELKNEGFDPADDDFYEEVDARLARQFPHKFSQSNHQSSQEDMQGETEQPTRLQDKTSSSASQVVSGASRTPKTSSAGGNGSKRVKLTQEDVRLANKWGIPLEQYAAEKLKVEEADGEYTTV